MQERHALREWLATSRGPDGLRDVVGWLAAYALESDEALRHEAATRFGAALAEMDTEAFQGVLCLAPEETPADWQDEAAWIVEVETLALARRGAGSLEAPRIGALREALTGLLVALTLRFGDWVGEHLWLSPLVARESIAGIDTSVLPWNEIRSGVTLGRLTLDGPSDIAEGDPVLAAWLDDRLRADDAAALRAWVAAPGRWQGAYRAEIVAWAASANLPRFDPARSTSVGD